MGNSINFRITGRFHGCDHGTCSSQAPPLAATLLHFFLFFAPDVFCENRAQGEESRYRANNATAYRIVFFILNTMQQIACQYLASLQSYMYVNTKVSPFDNGWSKLQTRFSQNSFFPPKPGFGKIHSDWWNTVKPPLASLRACRIADSLSVSPICHRVNFRDLSFIFELFFQPFESFWPFPSVKIDQSWMRWLISKWVMRLVRKVTCLFFQQSLVHLLSVIHFCFVLCCVMYLGYVGSFHSHWYLYMFQNLSEIKLTDNRFEEYNFRV